MDFPILHSLEFCVGMKGESSLGFIFFPEQGKVVLVVPLEFSPWPGEEWRLESHEDAKTPHISPFFGELSGDPGQGKAGWVGKSAEIWEDDFAGSRFKKKKRRKIVGKTRINPR